MRLKSLAIAAMVTALGAGLGAGLAVPAQAADPTIAVIKARVKPGTMARPTDADLAAVRPAVCRPGTSTGHVVQINGYAYTCAQVIGAMQRHVYALPPLPRGYAREFDDGRLNPSRGPRTQAGDAQMARLWQPGTVPMTPRVTQGSPYVIYIQE